MELFLSGHDFHYETENLCRLFFPYEKIIITRTSPDLLGEAIFAFAGIEETETDISYKARVRIGGKEKSAEKDTPFCEASDQERNLSALLFGVLSELCKYVPAWGILTGIHPVKLFRQLCEKDGVEKTRGFFSRELLVSDEKIALAERTMKNEAPILSVSCADSFSLYISIPFCPTRCAYCSFVSQSVERSAKLIPEYLQLLCEEIRKTGEDAAALSLRLESVYIGGGTPTTLSPEQLWLLMETIRTSFDLSTCREWTVEAGRPDTITPEKLSVIRNMGAKRISINPQTMNDEILRTIGRRHTAGQTEGAFRMARDAGFKDINTDLIIGLPGDTPEGFSDTLEKILSFDPENVTVHSLALKHAAQMMRDEEIRTFHRDANAVGKMSSIAQTELSRHGYEPYYLYRQSRSAGNLENLGWTKPGYTGYYNIYTMEETHTILACGAGAVSKLRDPFSDRMERIFNFKYSYEYVSRFSTVLERKRSVKELYDQFRKQL